MSGVRQHHVWQMLQRGFATSEYGQHHIWVYRKGETARKTVTKSFGHQKNFYSDQDSSADENITAFEQSVQGYLQEARSARHKEELDADTMAPVISHLEMRSSFIRSEFSLIVERVIQRLQAQLIDKKNRTKFLERLLRSSPDILDGAIPSELKEDPVGTAMQEYLQQNVGALSNTFSAPFAEHVLPVLEQFLLQLGDAAKAAHIAALQNDFSSVERASSHKKKRYFVMHDDSESLILPDTCLAFIRKNGCSPISQSGDKIVNVILPISPKVWIAGVQSPLGFTDAETAAKILATCAYQAFVAKENAHRFSQLAKRIGRNAQLMSDAEISRLVMVDGQFTKSD